MTYKPLYKIAEVCKLFHVTKPTVYDWVKHGKLKLFKIQVYHGHSFYHACRYIVTKQGAEVLYVDGVRGYDFKLMADNFTIHQQMRPAKKSLLSLLTKFLSR